MFAQLNRHEKVAYSVIVSLFLFGLSYLGAKRMRPAPTISIKELPALTSASASPTAPTSPPQTNSVELVVDVEGAVRHPGVYRFAGGSRILDAIQAAGGATQFADTTSLNLAQPLKDGQQVVVNGVASPAAPTAPKPSFSVDLPPATTRRGAKVMPPAGSIDLNSATAEDLVRIPGIGPSTAERILQLRQERGRINDVEELGAIKGLTRGKLELIKPVFHL